MISVFIPVYNEERIVRKEVERIYKKLQEMKESFEVFMIDDGSTDESPKIMREISKKRKRAYYLRFNSDPSRRENLALSFTKAKGNIIVLTDIDLGHNIKSLPRLVEGIKKGADIVTGSRYCKGANTRRRFMRWIVSRSYNWFVNLYFQTKITDHECGFKAFKREVALTLSREMGYDHSLKRGVFWDTELLLRALHHKYHIEEIPMIWVDREKSALSFKREIKMVPYMLSFKRKLKKEQKRGSTQS